MVTVYLRNCLTHVYITVVQSLDDDIDLPDLEGAGAVDKSDIKTENNTTEKDDTPTAAESSTIENISTSATNEQSSTNCADNSKNRNDSNL